MSASGNNKTTPTNAKFAQYVDDTENGDKAKELLVPVSPTNDIKVGGFVCKILKQDRATTIIHEAFQTKRR